MSSLNARLPDDKHRRLRLRTRRRGTTINRLIDEMTSFILAEFDAERRFWLRVQADAGKAARGLDLPNKALD